MMPRVRRFTDAVDFGICVQAFLSEHEAANNLPFRIIKSLAEKPVPVTPEIYLAVFLKDSGRETTVLGVALRTPPHNLVLSMPFRAEARAAVLADTAEFVLPGVVGPAVETEAFAAGWCKRTAGTAVLAMRMGVYALEEPVPAVTVPGRLRAAVPEDAKLAQEWTMAFHAEVMHHAPLPDAAIDLRGQYFWEVDGIPVTSVCARSGTPQGAVINAVYTPPALRRRGYATAAVAAASALMLAGGNRFCFLFTDLANPTSNGIYRRIGYRLAGEFRHCVFSPGAGH